MLYSLIVKLPQINFFTFGITIFGILFLSIGRDYFSNSFRTKFGIPIPMELFWVILTIILSISMDIETKHNVQIVAHIPTGLPSAALPQFDLLLKIWPDIISISIICYIFLFSLAKIFAKKHKTKIDSNQVCLH